MIIGHVSWSPDFRSSPKQLNEISCESNVLWKNRMLEVRRALKQLESRIDAEKMTDKINTDNLFRLINELELSLLNTSGYRNKSIKNKKKL